MLRFSFFLDLFDFICTIQGQIGSVLFFWSHYHNLDDRPVSVPATPAFLAILPSHGRKRKGSYSQPSSSQRGQNENKHIKPSLPSPPYVISKRLIIIINGISNAHNHRNVPCSMRSYSQPSSSQCPKSAKWKQTNQAITAFLCHLKKPIWWLKCCLTRTPSYFF